MRARLPGIVVTAFATTLAVADASTTVYRIRAAGAEIGKETVSREADGDSGTRLLGTTEIAVAPGVTIALRQDTRLDPEGRVLSYRVVVAAPNGETRIDAEPAEGEWKLRASGASIPETEKTVATKGEARLLDNNFPSHLDLLTRSLAIEPGEVESFVAVVPQVLQGLTATVRRLPDGGGAIDDELVTVRRHRLECAGLLLELESRPSDGALLRVSIPVQRIEMLREGYAPASPQTEEAPAERAAWREIETEVPGPGVSLPATLTLPLREGPFPAVVVLPGSGPQDRDETIGPNKPLRELARGLAARGVASIRFDKRTVAVKKPGTADTLRDEYVIDARAALGVLRAAEGIDRSRLFVIGHSLGGPAALLLAEEVPDLAGVVLLAAPARPLDRLVVDQTATQLRLAGADDATSKARLEATEKAFRAIREEGSAAPPFLGAPASYWRDVMTVDVPARLRALDRPALVLQGDEDIQVRRDLDFDALREKVGTREGRVTYRSFPGLNHLFQPVEGRSTGAEYGIAKPMDPSVAEAIAEWIAKVLARSSAPGDAKRE